MEDLYIREIEIKNISNADEEYLKRFYAEINALDERLIKLIKKHNMKIILADKFSDVAPEETLKELKKYKENYDISNIDKTTRGNCSDHIENGSIQIFYNNTKENMPAILYHEIGHLADYNINFEEPCFSSSKEFIYAYKKDLKNNWEKIKEDKRFRLVHYIQDSTPEKPNKTALAETFAHCFARINNKIDDVDIVGEYFTNAQKVTKKLVDEWLKIS